MSDHNSIAALDIAGLRALRADAHSDPQAALKDAAKQFEALFAHMLVKAMRATVPESGMQSQQGSFYQELLDQQWATEMANQGLGLAEMLTQQLADSVTQTASYPQASPVRADSSVKAGE